MVCSGAAALVGADAKTWVWEEFREAMEKDFRLASRKALQTFQQLTVCRETGAWLRL